MATIATMTFEEYKDIEHPAPYVLHLEGKSGAELLYYGSRHSCDPADPMFDDIRSRFLALQPNVVLVEGTRSDVPPPPTPLPPDPDDVIRASGEVGYVCFLANAHSVPILGLDPPFGAEVEHLLASFAKEQLFLFYCLEMVVQYRRMESRPSYEEHMGGFCGAMARWLDLKASMAPLALLHTLYEREFGHELNWETFPDELVCPLVWEGLTNEICRQSSYFRDSAQTAALLEAIEAHQKVFAVVGASHVVMQERALRSECLRDVRSAAQSTQRKRKILRTFADPAQRPETRRGVAPLAVKEKCSSRSTNNQKGDHPMTEQSENPFFPFRQRMSEQLGTPEAVLARFAAGPEDLDRALAGLSEPALDLARGPDKWTIRQIVHHIVDGDYMWGMCTRVAVGSAGATYRLDWYGQQAWVDALDHAGRPIAPALGLLRANRRHVVQLLEHLPDAWERYVLIPRPEHPDGFKAVVKDVILTQAVHVPWHIEQIRETRQIHGV